MSGITVEEAKRLWTASVPHGTNSDIALFTKLPNKDGTGGVEVSSGWYSRVSHSQWMTEVLGGNKVRRKNVGAISFANVLAVASETIAGWGLYATGTDQLRHFGPLRDDNGNETPLTISSGDNLEFADGDLIVGTFTPTTAFSSSLITEGEMPTLTTVNATPGSTTLYTVATGESVLVEVVVTAYGSDKHYTRRIRKKFRNTGGVTSQIFLYHEDVDGASETRDGLTTATAELTLSGNNVIVQVTGEGATTLRWVVSYEVRTDVP